jgi:hemerythrin-like domain-containing protein
MDLLGPIREQHRSTLVALAELDATLSAEGNPQTPEPLLAAVASFLDFYDRALAPHFLREERQVFPLMERYLPLAAHSTAAMHAEHDTARALVALVRRDLSLARAGSAAALAEMRATAPDLGALLREHIRKEEHALYPLLERLQAQLPRERRA